MEEYLTSEKMMAGMRYMPTAIGRVEAAFQMAEDGLPLKDEYDRYLVELGLQKAIAFKGDRYRWVQEAKVIALEHLLTMWRVDNDAIMFDFDCRAAFIKPTTAPVATAPAPSYEQPRQVTIGNAGNAVRTLLNSPFVAMLKETIAGKRRL